MAVRCRVCRDLSLARCGGGRGAGRHYDFAFGLGTAGFHSAARVRTVDRARSDDGRRERIEHTLPGTATHLLDSVLHPRTLDFGRGSPTSPAALVAAGADDRVVDKPARRLCGLACHARPSAD